VVLRPALERMVVTLGALQARSKKDLRRSFGPCRWITRGPVKIRRWIAVRAAVRHDQRAGEFIDWFIFHDALANPMVEILHPLLVQRMRFHTQQVSPFQR